MADATSNPDGVVRDIALRMLYESVVTTKTGDGKTLILAKTEHLFMEPGGIVVAMEGRGCFIWDGTREVNAFRLISAGFDMSVAATLAAVLNAVYSAMAERDGSESTTQNERPALPAT